jgi:general secretion pathway protein G
MTARVERANFAKWVASNACAPSAVNLVGYKSLATILQLMKKTSVDIPAARRRERGYSLLEILIVLTIIALIAALVGPRLMEQLDRSKVTAARVQVRAIAAALETMRLDLGRYPTDAEGIALLGAPPVGDDAELWRGPYLDADAPLDPWGEAYVYQAPEGPSGRPVVSSFGADRTPGGDGLGADISYGDT